MLYSSNCVVSSAVYFFLLFPTCNSCSIKHYPCVETFWFPAWSCPVFSATVTLGKTYAGENQQMTCIISHLFNDKTLAKNSFLQVNTDFLLPSHFKTRVTQPFCHRQSHCSVLEIAIKVHPLPITSSTSSKQAYQWQSLHGVLQVWINLYS